MSKSLGNFLTAHDLIQEWPGEVLRLALLSAHYRAPLDWTKAVLTQSKTILDGLYRTLYDLRDVDAEPGDAAGDILEALCDDLNTAKALTVLNGINDRAASQKSPAAKACLLQAGQLLGILHADPAAWLGYGQADAALAQEIEQLLQERQRARQSRDFKRADEIRDTLAAKNIIIEDTPDGPKWRQAG